MLAALGDKARAVAAMPNNHGFTPLHFVADNQDTEALKLMLAALGTDAQTVAAMPDKNGCTPLHFVARNEIGKLDTEALKLILAALGDKAAEMLIQRDSRGDTLEAHARRNKQYPEVLKIIQKPKLYIKKTSTMLYMSPCRRNFQRRWKTAIKPCQALLQESAQAFKKASQEQARQQQLAAEVEKRKQAPKPQSLFEAQAHKRFKEENKRQSLYRSKPSYGKTI